MLALIIVSAKIGGELVSRLGQPPVLGELLAGVALGAIPALEPLRSSPMLDVVAQFGAVLLLFEVGLESDLAKLLAVGWSALAVSCLGVITPMILGYGASAMLFSESGWITHLFVGATLTATSVGITARVLKDLRKTGTKEARIILGAAVADDVTGLVVLAVMTGLIAAAAGNRNAITWSATLWVVVKALAFLVTAVLAGRFWSQRVFHYAVKLRVPGVLLGICIAFCLVLAALAEMAGLAPILGAFAAGIVLEESHYRPFVDRGERDLKDLLAPINLLVVPVFFVLMGIRADLRSLALPGVPLFTVLISLAAILGKQVCGLGVLERGVNRLAIGAGMIPRGEVELIFAGLGTTLILEGKPVMSQSMYSAVVLMVIVTTVLTPPLLKAAFARRTDSK